MKFKIDENLPVEVSNIFISNNFDAQTVHEEGLTGANDNKINEICKIEKRIIITLDLDFADIRYYPPKTTPGIIVIRTVRQDKQFILQIISDLVEVLKTESATNKLWIVEESRIRIRE